MEERLKQIQQEIMENRIGELERTLKNNPPDKVANYNSHPEISTALSAFWDAIQWCPKFEVDTTLYKERVEEILKPYEESRRYWENMFQIECQTQKKR